MKMIFYFLNGYWSLYFKFDYSYQLVIDCRGIYLEFSFLLFVYIQLFYCYRKEGIGGLVKIDF